MPLQIRATIAHKIGFASHQNSVPFLRELIIENESDETIEDVDLTLTRPAYAEVSLHARS